MTDRRQPVVTGGCQCGAVRYAVYAEPGRSSLCHCRMCQKAVGGPFAALVKVARADFAWTRGRPSIFYSSPVGERGFCAACGTPLSFAYPDDDWLEVTLGSLDEPEKVPPKVHFGVESRHAWLSGAGALPAMRTDENTPPERLALVRSFQHPDHDTADGWTPPEPGP